jgi:hypothetical protein
MYLKNTQVAWSQLARWTKHIFSATQGNLREISAEERTQKILF